MTILSLALVAFFPPNNLPQPRWNAGCHLQLVRIGHAVRRKWPPTADRSSPSFEKRSARTRSPGAVASLRLRLLTALPCDFAAGDVNRSASLRAGNVRRLRQGVRSKHCDVLFVHRPKLRRVNGHHLDGAPSLRRHKDHSRYPPRGCKGKTLDELFVGYDSIIPGGQQTILVSETEGSMERHGLAACA